MSDPIRPKLPQIKPQIDTTISEKTPQKKSSETVRSSEPIDQGVTEKMQKASQDLATSKKADQQLQTISQKMNLSKDLTANQKKLLEAARKEKPAPDLPSLPVNPGNIDRVTLPDEGEGTIPRDALPGAPKERLNPFDSSGVQDYFSEEQGPPWSEDGPVWNEAPPPWTEIDN